MFFFKPCLLTFILILELSDLHTIIRELEYYEFDCILILTSEFCFFTFLSY